MAEDDQANRYQLASASTRRIEVSTKLWRYLTFEKFAWLLEKSKLYHTRLDFLGDPFEGSHTAAYVRKRDSGEEVRRIGHTAESEREIGQAGVYSKFATCWHESQYESAAMWKLYSAEHAGVAIVSTPLRMHQAVDLTPYNSGVLSPVEYLDFEKDDMTLRPISLGFGRFAMPGLLKRKSFQHENEVRGLIFFEDHAKMQLPSPFALSEYRKRIQEVNPVGISVSVDLNRLIEEIYISPLAKPHFKEVVEIMTKRHGLEDRIRPSSLVGEPVW